MGHQYSETGGQVTMTSTEQATDTTYPIVNIELTARITVLDDNGTSVPVKSLQNAVDVMSKRSGRSVVALVDTHRQDNFYQPTVWQLDQGAFTETNHGADSADYTLAFDRWQVLSTDGEPGPVLSGHPAAICQTMADRTNHIVTMTSHLPGVSDQTYTPTELDSSVEYTDLLSVNETADEDNTDSLTALADQLVETSSAQQNTSEQDPGDHDHFVDPTPAAAQDTVSDGDSIPATRREARMQRESFLTPTTTEAPATKGLRGMLSAVGIRVSPSAKERAEREDVRAISQHWPGPRTIAIANGKGGAGKTPTSIMLSAVFARFGGGTVLAWDNNQTRGTLGWRTEQGPHDSTVVELLPQADSLLAVGAQSADLAHFLHHQPADRYEVLRSKPSSLANEQRFDATDLDKIHSVVSKFFRLIIIDSGNDETDPLWRAMINHTDQLVVPTSTGDDKAEGAALLLEDLAASSQHGQHLADNAVVVVSQAEQTVKPSHRHTVAKGFEGLTRDVVEVPFDPAMVNGHLAWDALKPETQRAWIAAGAAVARGL